MEESGEVDAYADAAGERHLARLDGRFVRSLPQRSPAGRTLDVGCGPARIPEAYRRGRNLFAAGVDISLPMLREARSRGFTSVVAGSATHLPFADQTFDLVLSNSLLHHLANPVIALSEMARCVAPGGRLLLRDLRRPPRPLMRGLLAFLGRHYGGRMKELFEASVRAAYTPGEALRLCADARLPDARVRRRGLSYLQAEWSRTA